MRAIAFWVRRSALADTICAGHGTHVPEPAPVHRLSVLENVMLGRHTRMNNGFFSSLFALPSAGREEARAGTSRQILDLVGLASLVMESGQPSVRPATAGGTGARTRDRTAIAAAGRTRGGLNPQETAELGSC